MRKINQAGIELIKKFEGLRLKAYLCPAGKWTIGYGHTGLFMYPINDTVCPYEGLTITEDQAFGILSQDLFMFEKGVEKALGLYNTTVNDNQFSALVCFAFNVGLDDDADTVAEGLGDSTLLKRIKQGKFKEAADEFLKWNKAGGKVLAGLTKRREAERALFLTKDGQE